MRNKSVFLLLACVCGTIAAIGVSQWMQAQNTGNNAIEMVEIFVTTKTIDVAEEITADKIRLEQWPADRIPEGSTGNLEDIEGKFARQRFYAGEPLMPVKLMNDANGTSQTIPKNYSVVSMKADPENAVANLVRPGDRVNVMAYFKKSDMIPESMAKTVLKGVRVFAVDGRTERDASDDYTKAARTISLLINAKDAEAWTYATELGSIRLTLGNPGDYADSSSDADGNDAAEQFLSWLADHQRAQEERLRKQAEEEQEAAEPEMVAQPEKKPDSWRMVKIANGKVVEYEMTEGHSVPVIVRETGEDSSEGPGPELTEDALFSPPAAGRKNDGDYSYLNGANSPFFQPPTGEGPTAGPRGGQPNTGLRPRGSSPSSAVGL